MLCSAFISYIEKGVVQAGLNQSSSSSFLDQRDSPFCNTVGMVRVWGAGRELDLVVGTKFGDRFGHEFIVGSDVA